MGILGFILALFLCAQTTGMGMKTDEFKEISSRVVGSNLGMTTFEEMASRYCIISVCFLLFIISVLMKNNVFLKASGLFPLVVAVVQYGFLITLKQGLFKVNWAYSSWLGVTYCLDFAFLIWTIILLILQIYLIRIFYHSAIHSNP